MGYTGKTIKEYQHEYHIKNRERISLKSKEYYKKNREKILARMKAYKIANADKVKAYKRRYYLQEREVIRGKNRRIQYRIKYSISPEQFEELLRKQNGVCAICGRTQLRSNAKRLSIDHDHKTGKIRGLLCYNCNAGLGQFGDNIERLLKAAQYLKENS